MLDADAEKHDIYSVSEITREIKELLEYNMPTVWVQGELSNFVHHSSGHMYFSLKDRDAQLACVMWKSRGGALAFTPQNGMKLNAYGNIRVYEKRGAYQLDIVRMMPAGIGDLQLMFEALKKKLHAEGLFDQSSKKSIPSFPERIGIVTSPTGAAIRDIIHVLNRRFPSTTKILRPTLVQGDGAAEDIAHAIEEFNDYGDIDVLIVGRGGGSLEDLWAFNEEIVARAIFNSKVPIVSAVGHEIDYTISDFVADLRAPTPSSAAELVVPDSFEIANRIALLRNRCFAAVSNKLAYRREILNQLQKSYAFRHPLDVTLQYKQRVDELFHGIGLRVSHKLSSYRDKVFMYRKMIQSAHPGAVLNRGYAVVKKQRTKEIVRKVSQLEPNESLDVYIAKGAFTSTVSSIRQDDSIDNLDIKTDAS